jgi:hypothetical protein
MRKAAEAAIQLAPCADNIEIARRCTHTVTCALLSKRRTPITKPKRKRCARVCLTEIASVGGLFYFSAFASVEAAGFRSRVDVQGRLQVSPLMI